MDKQKHETLVQPRLIGSVSSKRISVPFIVSLALSAVAILIAVSVLIWTIQDPSVDAVRGGLAGAYGFVPLAVYVFTVTSRDKMEEKIARGKGLQDILRTMLTQSERALFDEDAALLSIRLLRDRDQTLFRLPAEDEAVLLEKRGEDYYVSRVLLD